MGVFKDAEGRPWTITITIMTMRRVRSDTTVDGQRGIDLRNTDTIAALPDDVFAICDVLYSLCQIQAKERGIDEQAFGHIFGGVESDEEGAIDVLKAAEDCLMEELVLFTRPPSKRKALKKALAKRAEMTDKLMEAQNEVLDGPLLDENLERAKKELNKELQQQFGNKSTPAPESSDSIPDPSLSES